MSALLQALFAIGPAPNSITFLDNGSAVVDMEHDQVVYPDEAVQEFVSAIQRATTSLVASRPLARNVSATAAVSSASSSASATDPSEQPAPRFRCRQCTLHYATAAVLNQHVKDIHTGTVCYWPGCAWTTSTELELRDHLKDHQKDAIRAGGSSSSCHWPGCNSTFGRNNSVNRCLLTHNAAARKLADNENFGGS
ncbi:hypothetical protein HD806DRAFT_529801 [Xylariaceae sp. AK1471]|nr:hypothetical protein HD806DRAFT_529801 [Xylariaceae sp. AK1471]